MIVTLPLLFPVPAHPDPTGFDQPALPAEVTRIALGSCARNGRPQPIWPVIEAAAPDLFVFLGDNVYADIGSVPETVDQIRAAYDELAAEAGWSRFRSNVPVLATWDDHDFGKNDAGVEWELKQESQQEFLDFFGISADSPRRQREGIYHAELLGSPGRRVQVLLLDTRYHRDALQRRSERGALGPYRPATGGQGTLLGEAQWRWLEEQLAQPAELRVLVSSIQVVADEHGWEGWGNLPHERARLYDLIDRTNANGVVVVSGDRHLLELSCELGEGVPYPLFDLTTSGLNQSPSDVAEPNAHRVGPVLRRTNFGWIEVDWERGLVTLQGRGLDGEVLLAQHVWLDRLRERR